MGDRQGRLFRVDRDRRKVQAHVRLDLREAELCDAADLDAQTCSEGQAHPGREAARREIVTLPADLQPAVARVPVDQQAKGNTQVPGAFADAVLRPAHFARISS